MYESVLRDPTPELASLLRPRKAPPVSLEGKTVALMDIAATRNRPIPAPHRCR